MVSTVEVTKIVDDRICVVEAAVAHVVETSVEVTVETLVMVEVGSWTVAVGAVATLVEVEMISTRTPHETLSGNFEEGLLRLRWRSGRRAARRSDRAGVAAARFFNRLSLDADDYLELVLLDQVGKWVGIRCVSRTQMLVRHVLRHQRGTSKSSEQKRKLACDETWRGWDCGCWSDGRCVCLCSCGRDSHNTSTGNCVHDCSLSKLHH